jgi:hypothetical protein
MEVGVQPQEAAPTDKEQRPNRLIEVGYPHLKIALPYLPVYENNSPIKPSFVDKIIHLKRKLVSIFAWWIYHI